MRGEFRICQDVRHLLHGTAQCRAPYIGADAGGNRVGAAIFNRSGEVVCSRQIEQLAALLEDRPDLRAGQGDGRFHERVRARLEVECGAADNFQDVGSSGLLLQ